VRLRKGLPTLRESSVRRAIERALAFGNRRAGFRLVHFSLQSNHIHLLVEAGDRRALSRGMQALLVRVSRALNRHWKRRGPVFWDRFHARPLRTPREVRTALVYVLQNARHHGLKLAGPDPYSSGRWFDGWKRPLDVAIGNPGVPPRTWLLRTGWRKHGCIGLEESPAGARGREETLPRRHGSSASRVEPPAKRRPSSIASKQR
jgi:REP element-mobilizing transposase RayT